MVFACIIIKIIIFVVKLDSGIISKQEFSNTAEIKYSADSGEFNNAISRLNIPELLVRRGGKIILNPELLKLMA
jgi:hypothetical protein